MHLPLLLLCFFASGAAALLYETAWTREFTTVFGTSELAIAAVLAAYMAGLAAGAALAGSKAARIRRPVLLYGLLELGIALGALAVPLLIRGVTALYVITFGGHDTLPEGESLLRTLFHVAGAFAVLMPCAALMGATLPLLARHAVRSDQQLGPRVGVLYAVNTAGAIAGTLGAGFWLLPWIGLRQTVYVGVAINALVFAAAALLARDAPPVPPAPTTRAQPGPRWILVAMLLSGAVSFGYEVLWSRLIGHLIGGSTQAFATMLASFLLGIALGSAVAARFARSAAQAARGFALAQLGAAVSGWLAFALANRLPELARHVGASAYAPEAGALVAVAALLPLTFCLGATFPFAVRLHARDAQDAGPASARVYAWNTVGSIVGAVATGVWLLPALGFASSVMLGVATSLGLSLLAVGMTGRALLAAATARRGMLSAAAAAAALLWVFPPQAPEALLRHAPLSALRQSGELVYLGVGRSATVTLSRHGLRWRLFTNGLPEAAIEDPRYPPAMANETQWLALAPWLARPDARRVLLVGLGGGATLAAFPPAFERVEVVEIEPRVLDANRIATPRRGGDPLEDPRVRIHVGDARGALLLSTARYDAIVSQPSHPWTAGASHLYTREFFELARHHLSEGGVLVQWMSSMFVDEELLRSLLATLLGVFPHVEVLRPDAISLVFVASAEPLDLVESGRRALEADAEALGAAGLSRIEHIAAVRALTTDAVRSLAAGAFPLTDDHNPLGSGPRAGIRSKGLDRLLVPHDPLHQRPPDLEPIALVRRLALMNHAGRLGALLEGLAEAQAHSARGWLAWDRGQRETAALHFERSLEADPSLSSARLGLLLLGREGEAPTARSPEEMLLARAIRAEAAGDQDLLRELDAELARVETGHLAYPEAARLRIDWRLRAGSPKQGAEALALVDALLQTGWRSEDLVRRARAAAQTGQTDLAWEMLAIAARSMAGARVALRREAVAFSRSLPDHEDAHRIRDALQRRRTREDVEVEDALGVEAPWPPAS